MYFPGGYSRAENPFQCLILLPVYKLVLFICQGWMVHNWSILSHSSHTMTSSSLEKLFLFRFHSIQKLSCILLCIFCMCMFMLSSLEKIMSRSLMLPWQEILCWLASKKCPELPTQPSWQSSSSSSVQPFQRCAGRRSAAWQRVWHSIWCRRPWIQNYSHSWPWTV